MHAVTESVRAQYERFPYPTQAAALRQGSDARLLLSYVEQCRPDGARPIQVLDAGCGRGVGLVACATLQADVEFTGVDLSRSSLEHVRGEVATRHLSNVRVQEIDLMTLDGLEVPPGGFDVILSSGVVHHLADPAAGLARLAGVLAPHGVLSLMVYGHRGRESLYRLVRAMDALVPRDVSLEERLAVARELALEVHSEPLLAGPWKDQCTIDDSEFVDRYLNVNETSYDIPGVFDLLEQSDLKFLRWTEPADWALEVLLPEGKTRARALGLGLRERWKLVDELFWRPSLELILCQPGNRERTPVSPDALLEQPLCLSPEVSFHTEHRNLRGAVRTERLRLRVRGREPIDVPAGPTAQALLLLAQQMTSFRGADLVHELAERGVDAPAALAAIADLIRLEVLARPHAVDA